MHQGANYNVTQRTEPCAIMETTLLTHYPVPDNEYDRLAYLKALHIDYEDGMPALDGLVNVAAQIAETPIALISLVGDNEQRFVANVGLEGVGGTERDVAFCAHAIMGNRQLVIPDATQDDRFQDNPLVTGAPEIRAYAGTVLEPEQDMRVGTLCVIDREPRDFTEAQLASLHNLGLAVENLLLMFNQRRNAQWDSMFSRF